MNKLYAMMMSLTALFTSCDSRVIDVQPKKETPMNVYNNPLNDLYGNAVEQHSFDGKATLIVNLASKCGLTPQYEDLQKLHERYKDQGFSVVGFPCNDFGGQEPGDADTIAECATGFGVDFPIMEKVSVVKGDSQCAIYTELNEATGALPEWNFGKYLIDKNGTPIAFFGSMVEPLSPEITERIEDLLNN